MTSHMKKLTPEEREQRAERMRFLHKRRTTMDGASYYRWFLKSQCVESPSGCWLFQGFIHKNGYGSMYYNGRNWRPHRLAFYLWRGPIPMGCDICHSCDVRNCCNPDHLWPGRNVENLHDASRKGRHHCQVKTHCPQGHPYDKENTLIVKTRSYTGVGRQCKACNRARQRSPQNLERIRQSQRRRRALKRAQRLGSGDTR
jgi:hypothetical protein